MKGVENKFIIKMVNVAEWVNAESYFVDKGKHLPLVYGISDECVSVVLEHNNHEKQANVLRRNLFL